MKKLYKNTVYVAVCSRLNEEFDIGFSYNRMDAIRMAKSDMVHTSSYDLKRSSYYVAGYETESSVCDNAKSSFMEWSDELCWLPDPVFYIDL